MRRTEAPNPAPGYAQRPDHRVEIHPCAKRVRGRFGDAWVADSTRTLLVRETGRTPVYYFPREDVDLGESRPSDRKELNPFTGEARFRPLRTGARLAPDAAWSYEAPYDEAAALAGYVAFDWSKVDAWFEEDEEVYVHPRDPFVRVDVLPSSRKVEVVLGGEVIASTTAAHFVFETGLPVRYYIPKDDVRMDLLTPTATQTECPYKGEAWYWSATVGGETCEDVAWAYADPLPEVAAIAGKVCFYNERVDEIRVAGVVPPKPGCSD